MFQKQKQKKSINSNVFSFFAFYREVFLPKLCTFCWIGSQIDTFFSTA